MYIDLQTLKVLFFLGLWFSLGFFSLWYSYKVDEKKPCIFSCLGAGLLGLFTFILLLDFLDNLRIKYGLSWCEVLVTKKVRKARRKYEKDFLKYEEKVKKNFTVRVGYVVTLFEGKETKGTKTFVPTVFHSSWFSQKKSSRDSWYHTKLTKEELKKDCLAGLKKNGVIHEGSHYPWHSISKVTFDVTPPPWQKKSSEDIASSSSSSSLGKVC